MKKLTPQENLERAVLVLFMQVYGHKRDASHGPTVAQWCMVGAALDECGVALPPDWVDVLDTRSA
jgi:hypothetical protein